MKKENELLLIITKGTCSFLWDPDPTLGATCIVVSKFYGAKCYLFSRAASLIELTVPNIVGVEHHVDVAGVRALVSVPPDMQPIQINKIYVIHIFSSNLQEIN